MQRTDRSLPRAVAPLQQGGGATQVQETDGTLAVGLTEPNPAFLWPGEHPVPGPFERWRREVDRLAPRHLRLVVDWAALAPTADAEPDLALAQTGCMRDLVPCAGWGGLREQLAAIAARQAADARVDVLVVLTGTPTWAARPASGCERAGTAARSRTPTRAGLAAYARLVGQVLAAAEQAGARLQRWSPWNEPNHPYTSSPQRERCAADAPSAAVAPYVALADTLRVALEAAPGEQQMVLGELAGLPRRSARATEVGEFIGRLPRRLVCASTVWTQHAYVGGEDPVDAVASAISRHGCDRTPEIWITETGVGAARNGGARAAGSAAERSACKFLHEQLVDWYEDPRVTAAFQYTVREDDRFPTGLVTTALDRAYPALAEWQAWGGVRAPDAPAPASACG